MKRSIKRRPCLRLESLEGREVPAVGISYYGGNLTITGDQVANNLTVKAVADNQVQVTNQVGANPAVNYGTYNLTGKLSVMLGNSADQFTLDLNGKTINGSVMINTGSGDDFVNITSSTSPPPRPDGSTFSNVGLGKDAATAPESGSQLARSSGSVTDGVQVPPPIGTIQGSVTIITGFGDDFVSFSSVRVGGYVSVDGSLGFDAVVFNFTELSSNLTVSNGNFVASDVPFDVGGNMIVTTTEAQNNVFAFGMNVAGNVTINSGGGNDILRLNEDGYIAGNLTALLGAGNNTYQQGSNIGPTGAFDVGGSLSILAGSGNDNFQIGNKGATIFGNMNVNAGDGNNLFNLPAGCIVAGSSTLYAGNGNDSVTMDAQVNGNANFSVGNGANSATISQAPLGRLSWTSGGGGSQLTLGSATSLPGNWNVAIYFGGGSDTFTLDATAGSQSIRGIVDGGFGTDSFVFNPNWTLDSAFMLNSF